MARPLSSSAVAAAASAAPALSPAAPPALAPASSAVVESSSSSGSSSGGWGAWAGRAVLTATAVAAVGAVAYAVYFDYRRRNDPEFRRHLRALDREDRKLAAKQRKQNVDVGAMVKEQVELAEKFAMEGKFAESAMCFVRVFHVYPNKQELVMIVQQSMPEPVFVAFVELLQREGAINMGGGGGRGRRDESVD